ncbi:MlaC/ttg2D family ABC transporter substrate-binding protein [Sulfurospirillum arcachonense]|uniref:MlaC/ttg2D family ABC transporter substrate-binding protein n=1 Tax=Sulfurospirillum arcachonense TaxID=57666 RepID=UPI000469CF1D|nr:ABC transporter substrate-binding protein [Sulfurospirillum arcachonense]
MIKNILLILSLFFSTSLFAVEKENITKVLKEKMNIATYIIKQKELDLTTKANKLFPIFEDIFDYRFMTKLSLGKSNWIAMTPAQREEFTQKFISHLKNSYIEKLNLYTDERLRIIELQEKSKNKIWLLTELIGKKDTYAITYKFYKSKNNEWMIYDLDIIGVSLIQTYRAQFKDILKTQSYETLLSKLDKKDT